MMKKDRADLAAVDADLHIKFERGRGRWVVEADSWPKGFLRRLRAAGHTVRVQLPPMPERNLVSGGRPSRNRERATANPPSSEGPLEPTAAFARAGGESSGADDEMPESPARRMYHRSVAQADDLGHMSISQLKRGLLGKARGRLRLLGQGGLHSSRL